MILYGCKKSFFGNEFVNLVPTDSPALGFVLRTNFVSSWDFLKPSCVALNSDFPYSSLLLLPHIIANWHPKYAEVNACSPQVNASWACRACWACWACRQRQAWQMCQQCLSPTWSTSLRHDSDVTQI